MYFTRATARGLTGSRHDKVCVFRRRLIGNTTGSLWQQMKPTFPEQCIVFQRGQMGFNQTAVLFEALGQLNVAIAAATDALEQADRQQEWLGRSGVLEGR